MTTQRKLAAILAADAAGYSRLMADDEAATLRALNESRDIFRKRIEAHGGRLIDTAGDSILAEFPAPSKQWTAPTKFSANSSSATTSWPSTGACSSVSASTWAM